MPAGGLRSSTTSRSLSEAEVDRAGRLGTHTFDGLDATEPQHPRAGFRPARASVLGPATPRCGASRTHGQRADLTAGAGLLSGERIRLGLSVSYCMSQDMEA